MYQKNKTLWSSILIFLIQYAVHVPTLSAWLLKEITEYLMISRFVWGIYNNLNFNLGLSGLFNSTLGGNHWPTFIMLKAPIGSLCWVSGTWTLVRRYWTMDSCFLCSKVDHGSHLSFQITLQRGGLEEELNYLNSWCIIDSFILFSINHKLQVWRHSCISLSRIESE